MAAERRHFSGGAAAGRAAGSRLMIRLLIAAAVFVLLIGGMAAFSHFRAAAYPGRVILPEEFLELEAEGIKVYGRKKKNGFRTTDFDSRIYIEQETDIRSVEFEVTYVRRPKGVSERSMEIYYDTGEGFRQQECVQARLKKGTTRISFAGAQHVRRIRIDFFNNENCKIRLNRISLNTPAHYHTGALFLFGGISLVLLVLITASSGRNRFAAGLFGWAALMLMPGLPLTGTPRDGRVIPFLILTGSAMLLLYVLLMEDSRRKEHLFAAVLCVFAFCLYYYWSSLMPYAEGPDEAMHLDVVYYIRANGVLPRGDDPAIRNRIWGFSYAYSPILPYIIGGYLQRIVQHFSSSFRTLVMTARMVSILSGTATVFFTWKLSELLFPRKEIRYLLPVFTGMFPELAFINTYVNSDAMAIMTTAMIMYFWASGSANNWRIKDAVGLSAAMGLCALTYYNCYGFILMSVPLFFCSIAQSGKSRKEIVRMTGLIVLLTAAVCGWWFVRNLIIYDGDLLGRATLNKNAEIYAQDGYKPSQILSPLKQGYSLPAMLTELEFVSKTLRSFIAMFSNYLLRARHHIYVLYRWIIGIGLLGSFAAGMSFLKSRGWKDKTTGKRICFWICAILALFIVLALAVYYSYAVDFQPQGRYILPCIVPLGCLITAGYDLIFRGITRLATAFGRSAAADGRGTEGGFPLTPVLSAVFAAAVLQILFDTVCLYYLG